MRRDLLKWPMALLFATSGVAHFAVTDTFMKIMPPWLPEPRALVWISGAAEIVLAVLLLDPALEREAAWGLVALLVAVFPANIQMWLDAGTPASQFPTVTPFAAAVRLPFQALLVWWAYVLTRPRTQA